MRIYTFNVNGIKPCAAYPPWNEMKGNYGKMFEHIKADILCVQELKLPRKDLTKAIACPPGYDAFLSFPITGHGRSGVGIFTSQSTLVPLLAEEGMSGHNLDPPNSFINPPLAQQERIGSYPLSYELDLDDNDPSSSDLKRLDQEGRCVVVDLGLFVLINVYCPNETNDERLPFKLNFLKVLEARMKALVAAGRDVMIVGDINVVHQPMDHGEGSLASKQEGFWNHPARKWFDSLIAPKGLLTDVVREAHPTREGMFTCWNVKIEARASNYGTRLDYILVTKGLLPWVKSADICPELRGSDHCPVFVELHDELLLPGASTPTRIRDLLNARSTPDAKTTGPPTPDGDRTASLPPRAAGMFYSQFNSRTITSFFTKRSESNPLPAPSSSKSTSAHPTSQPDPSTSHSNSIASSSTSHAPSSSLPLPSESIDLTLSPPPSSPPTSSNSTAAMPPPPSKNSTAKGKARASSSSLVDEPPGLVKKKKKGQLKLSSFFAPSQPTHPPSPPPKPKKKRPSSTEDSGGSSSKRAKSSKEEEEEDADHLFAMALAEEEGERGGGSASGSKGTGKGKGGAEAKEAWTELLKPVPKPKCTVHGVECIEKTTTKPGPNKGKRFWLCSLPLGPGHNSGGKANGRLNEEVDVRYKCDFFLWSSEARKNASGAAGRAAAKGGK
ncbi:Endonuclease/exonuclease/phosphatase [Mrakia frigida]|uniref:Endonuclease/exonuclease/phosphatase n=1 Tax=Mrakia frigida TaxID=29902 RepID=UPI003FCBF55D